ncbi:MAG: NAD(P)-binding protein, partial [Rhodoferax sp.]|nr:NAD(P)-binding protein [Rhodoferax sp.]
MGKITGFMEYPRLEEGYRPVSERVKEYREFVLALDDGQAKIQSARCMDCGTPFCNNGCPVNNIIPDFNDLVFQGDWKNAAAVLHSTNNFPEFTGRICPAPCEAACTLNVNDDAVGIKSIEHAISDKAWANDWVKPQKAKHRTGKSVAVVGSGPAGLAAAQQLARVGHDVTVFEKNDRIGGLLRYGIPDFKLEKSHIDRRVAQMQAEG